MQTETFNGQKWTFDSCTFYIFQQIRFHVRFFLVQKLFQFPLNNLKEFVGKSLDILLTDFV